MSFFDLSLAILSLFVCDDVISSEDLELILKKTYEHFHNSELVTVTLPSASDR